MLLYTEGNKSKRRRVCALNCVKSSKTVFVAAGWGTRTGWYRNLLAKPHARIRLGGQHFSVKARVLGPGPEAATALALLQKLDGGPPKALRPLLKKLGFDFEAERELSFAHPESLTWVALDLQ